MLVRRMRPDDAADVERLTADAFHDLAIRTRPAGTPEPPPRSPQRSQAWLTRLEHLVAHDPSGCWVAEEREVLLGAAAALRRETLWGLSTLAVRPGIQSRGIGRALLDAALSYSEGCVRGIICSSPDPRAARRYRLAGFALHPTTAFSGSVDRSALPVVEHVREATPADLELCDSVDRQIRGAAHGVDHEPMMRQFRLVVVDHTTGSGYCYVLSDGGPYLLAATNRRTAQRLLWESLAAAPEAAEVEIDALTAEQDWALDVAFAAGLTIRTEGYLALRHMRPPVPYVPSGHFL